MSVLSPSLRRAGPHVHADSMPFALLRSGGLNTGNMLNWGVTVDGVMGGRSSGTASVVGCDFRHLFRAAAAADYLYHVYY